MTKGMYRYVTTCKAALIKQQNNTANLRNAVPLRLSLITTKKMLCSHWRVLYTEIFVAQE